MRVMFGQLGPRVSAGGSGGPLGVDVCVIRSPDVLCETQHRGTCGVRMSLYPQQ